MTYVYQCSACGHLFDVVKPVKDMEVNESCPDCGEYAIRQFMPQRLYFTKTKVEHPEYNPGLGCVVRNSAHRKQICKEKGLEEIGNENQDKLFKKMTQDQEEKRDKAYDQAFDEARQMALSPSSIPPVEKVSHG